MKYIISKVPRTKLGTWRYIRHCRDLTVGNRVIICGIIGANLIRVYRVVLWIPSHSSSILAYVANETLNIPTVTYPLQPISRSVLGVLRPGRDITGFAVTSSRFVCKIRIWLLVLIKLSMICLLLDCDALSGVLATSTSLDAFSLAGEEDPSVLYTPLAG